MQRVECTIQNELEEYVDVCSNCKTAYRVIMFKLSKEKKDSGIRYCPYCSQESS